MKFYMVASVCPDGRKTLVGHILQFEEDSWRSEVYDTLEEATAMRDYMESAFEGRGMTYEVHEMKI